MPEYVVTDPSGKEFVVTAPDGASQDEVLQYAQQNFGQQAAAPQEDAGMMSQIKSALGKAAIPTALGIAGGTVGAMTPIPGGAVIGDSAGSAIGEIINQQLGITEPSMAQVGLAAAAPGGMRALAGGARHLGGAVLKSTGGRQLVADIGETLLKRVFKPATSVDELFEQVAKSNVRVPTARAAATLKQIAAEEAENLPTKTKEAVEGLVKKYLPYFEPQDGVVASPYVNNIATATRDLRVEAAAAFKAGDSRLGNAINAIRASLFDDATGSGVPQLAQASKLARRDAAVDELAAIVRNANPLKHFKDFADKNPLFAGAFNQQEKDDIAKVLTGVSQAAPSGFAGVLGRTILAGAGATIGATGSDGSSAGAVGGAVAGALSPELAAYVLSRQAGRKFMERMLQGKAFDVSMFSRSVAMFGRALMAEDAKNGETAKMVKAVVKDENASLEDKIKMKLKQAEESQGGAQAGAQIGSQAALSQVQY
jgi:hypothetical protein